MSRTSHINNKQVLDTSNWKEFRYDEIFNMERGVINNTPNTQIGEYPLIGASKYNNGCNGDYIDVYHHEGNSITVGNAGQTGVGNAFYQEHKFASKTTINVLTLKNYTLNKYIAFFLVPLIKKEKYRFNFGRAWNLERMRQSKIKLPVQEDGTPDYLYMENHIKEIWDKYIPKLDAKLTKEFDIFKNEFPETSHINNKQVLDTSKWKWFKVGDLFDVYTGKDKPKTSLGSDTVYSIENLTTNNGRNGKVIAKENDVVYDNFISMVSIGAGGKCFYQNKPSVCYTRVKGLIPKFNLNKYIAFFLITLLNKEQYRFNYGRVVDSNKALNTKIKLPVQEDGTPDYLYMENHIKKIGGAVCARIRERIKQKTNIEE